MTNIINKMLMALKILALLASFALCLYILLYMYYSLNKEPWGKDFFEFISVLIPFALLLIFFVINVVAKQKLVNNNIFYNVTCVVVLLAILYMEYRALTDQNMILWHKTEFKVNFDYFADQIFQIKAMLYGLSAANVFMLIESSLAPKKTLEIND